MDSWVLLKFMKLHWYSFKASVISGTKVRNLRYYPYWLREMIKELNRISFGETLQKLFILWRWCWQFIIFTADGGILTIYRQTCMKIWNIHYMVDFSYIIYRFTIKSPLYILLDIHFTINCQKRLIFSVTEIPSLFWIFIITKVWA